MTNQSIQHSARHRPIHERHVRWLAALGVGLLLNSGAAAAETPTSVRIDTAPAHQQQTFEAWGTSLAWFGHIVGGWEDQALRDSLMDRLFDPRTGLGISHVRYNIGGGQNPDLADTLRPGADVPGYQPRPGVYDWTADANQRWVLQAAIDRGADKLEAFSNSPPWWMTQSKDVRGHSVVQDDRRRTLDNLSPARYSEFADYLTTVVKHFHDEWDITFDTLAPMNEPDAHWWNGTGKQEGCYIARTNQDELLLAVHAKMVEKGLDHVVLVAPEENSIQRSYESYTSYAPAVQQLVAQVNTHSYSFDGQSNRRYREMLRDLVQGQNKRLYMSEFGTGETDDLAGGLTLARTITEDLATMQAIGWTYWQAIENADMNGGWGLIHAPFDGREEFTLRRQFHVFRQFSNFIRPGFVILNVEADDVLAAFDPASGEVVLVVTNPEDTPRELVFDLSAIAGLDTTVERVRTSPTEAFLSLPDLQLRDGRLEASFAPSSVTSFRFTCSDQRAPAP